MTTLREAAQQALEALYQAKEFTELYDTEHAAAVNERCHENITALRAALAEDALDRLAENERALGIQMEAPRAALAQQAEPVATVTECEACFTPDVCQLRGTCDYYTASQMRIAAPQQQAEPVEPVAWAFRHSDGTYHDPSVTEHSAGMVPLYPPPPQRKPLTDEEIDRATAQARDALLDHIYEYGTAAEGVLERIRKLCRAVERALEEKNRGR